LLELARNFANEGLGCSRRALVTTRPAGPELEGVPTLWDR